MDPIEVVLDDPHLGRQRIVGRIEPPQIRRDDLDEIEFAIREVELGPHLLDGADELPS